MIYPSSSVAILSNTSTAVTTTSGRQHIITSLSWPISCKTQDRYAVAIFHAQTSGAKKRRAGAWAHESHLTHQANA